MSLRGSLLVGSAVFALCFVALSSALAFLHSPQKPVVSEQTTFSAEEEKFEHPVPLNKAAKEALAAEQSISDVLRDDQLSVDTMPEDWFTSSEVHLSSANEADLVVMGTQIARGPYTCAFWVLRKSRGGYKVVFRNNAHSLELLRTKTNGLRNILTALVTLNYNSTAEYEFDGESYRITRRTLEPNTPVGDLNPAEYETRETFIQLPGEASEPVVAKARSWIWEHWQSRRSAYARVSTHDNNGEQQDCLFFIDADSKSGEMHAVLRDHRIAWEQDSPSGPRHKVVQDQTLVANQIERMEASPDESQAPKVLPEKEKVPPTKYQLHFLAEGRFDLFTL